MTLSPCETVSQLRGGSPGRESLEVRTKGDSESIFEIPEKDPLILIWAGDRVRYEPIEEREFAEIKRLVEKGGSGVTLQEKSGI